MALVTLSETKAALGIADTAQDTRITALLDPVSAAVESYAGRKFTSGAETEKFDGGGEHLILHRYPVTSITSVTDEIDEETIDASEYEVEESTGLLRRLPAGSIWEGSPTPSAFRDMATRPIRRRWTVVYVGGATPEDVKLACYEVIASLLAGAGGMLSEKDGDYSYTRGASGLPETARLMLAPYRAAQF